MNKLTKSEIYNILNTNLNDWKKESIDHFESIAKVNDLIDADDLHTIIGYEFYNDLNNNQEYIFNDVLDKHYLGYLDIGCNSWIVMNILHNIYNV